MILILNCLLKEKSIESFNKTMDTYLKELSIDYEIFRAIEANKITDFNSYSHLIISGSGASVLDDNSWNSNLEKIIMHFVNNKKPVLGICYGEQYLAKVLAGSKHIRKTKNPEIGFANIEIGENELFEGIINPVFSVYHYDEVFDLNEDFNVIAQNQNCGVHGFQYKNLPIWGTQFHPEYDLECTKENIQEAKEKEPNFKKYYIYDLEDNDRLIQNKLIFKNFVNSDKISLRPHHLLCIQNYIGKGYSEEFVENMDIIIGKLKSDKEQIIRIIEGNDHVCNHCPNNIGNNKCESNQKVLNIDAKVLKYLEIEPGIYKYSYLLELLDKKLNNENKKDICADCEWYELCH